jgi:hypothetical protein
VVLVNLLKNLLVLFFALLLAATFFWLWGRFGYSYWAILLIVLFLAVGLLLARWARQHNQGS